MATRRRGAASLDDLKAKLGYADSGEDAAESGTPEGETTPDGGEGDAAETSEAPAAAASTPAPAASTARPAAATRPAFEDEDYSAAVAETPTPETMSLPPVAEDVALVAPMSRNLTATIIAAAVALLLGVALGIIGVSNNTVRKMENAAIGDAQSMLDAIRPVSSALTSLDNDLSTLPANVEYTPAFEDRLREAYGSSRPVIDPAALNGAKTLLVRNEPLARQLVEYAIATSFLGSLVDRHLRATQADDEEIQRLQAGIVDEKNYAIAIEFEQQLAKFQAFAQDPDANPFQPVTAERVTYDDLEMVVRGEGEARREFYTVKTATGESIEVLVHDLVMLPRDQLLPPVSNENALDRYRARAAQIKEYVANTAAMQSALISQLDEVANSKPYFTF